jgi:hypothetical protein
VEIKPKTLYRYVKKETSEVEEVKDDERYILIKESDKFEEIGEEEVDEVDFGVGGRDRLV